MVRPLPSFLGILRLLLVMVLLIGISFASSEYAAAALRVREDARHADLWFRFYDDLPHAWKTSKTILVREFSPRDMERLVARMGSEAADSSDDSFVDGCYQDESESEDAAPTITLSDTLQGEEAGLVFTHEYAHFVWEEMLTRAQRERYQRLWKTQKHNHHLVTEYAGESDEEGFAEAFAYFVRRPAQLLRKDAASSKFLHDLLASRTGGRSEDEMP